MRDRLHRLGHPNFGPNNVHDEVNDHVVADIFWATFQKESERHGQYESTWAALRAVLRYLDSTTTFEESK